MTDASARALLRRFGQFADQFARCFNWQAQRDAASQYLDALFTLGKTANCQGAVSTVLVDDQLAWPLTFELYLPQDWVTDAPRRAKAGFP